MVRNYQPNQWYFIDVEIRFVRESGQSDATAVDPTWTNRMFWHNADGSVRPLGQGSPQPFSTMPQ